MDTGLDPFSLTIFTALEMLRSRKISPMELTAACLQRINQFNPSLNAFITILKDSVRNDAQDMINKGNLTLPLFGIPISIKDLYDTKGTLTTAGSLFFRDYEPDKDSAVIEKIKQSGALIMGKTNSHEFAFGVTGVNPHFGACRNPWDTARISGGSSSGSAVAVATGMSLGALGTDTGGSIRIPASLCGVVGLKPTFGRVSLRGIVLSHGISIMPDRLPKPYEIPR